MEVRHGETEKNPSILEAFKDNHRRFDEIYAEHADPEEAA